MTDIKLCKLVTGEIVVGELCNNGLESILKNCLLLQAMPMPETNQMRMGISPYLAPYSRENADIATIHCMVTVDADPELIAQYQQITSGIVMAAPGDLKNLNNLIQMPSPSSRRG